MQIIFNTTVHKMLHLKFSYRSQSLLTVANQLRIFRRVQRT